MSNDNILRSTPQEDAAGTHAALTVAISALIATHPDRRVLKGVLTTLAAQTRRDAFDEGDAVDFIRDAYDKNVGHYLQMIDTTDQFVAGLAA